METPERFAYYLSQNNGIFGLDCLIQLRKSSLKEVRTLLQTNNIIGTELEYSWLRGVGMWELKQQKTGKDVGRLIQKISSNGHKIRSFHFVDHEQGKHNVQRFQEQKEGFVKAGFRYTSDSNADMISYQLEDSSGVLALKISKAPSVEKPHAIVLIRPS